MKKLDQSGSHIIAGVLALVVVAIIVAVGYRVTRKSDEQSQASTPQQSQPSEAVSEESQAGPVTWFFNDQESKWVASDTAPACKEPYVFSQSPVDVAKASAILYPGQSRGNNYKPHGGFIFNGLKNGDVTVSMPADSVLVGGSRYIEMGEVQYLLDFQTSCGIAFRFDHLLTLSPKVQAITDKFPEPKVDDTRTNNVSPVVEFKAGEAIATAVGFVKIGNVSVDFGVYDYREPNQASKNAVFAAAQGQFKATTFYGVCWFDMLPTKDAVKVKALPGGDQQSDKKSDYCK